MRLGIDIGGTFTDLAAVDPQSGALVTAKGLNSGSGLRGGVLHAMNEASVELDDVTDLTHGTTVVTNLLIEGTGAPVGLLCSTGFRDVLEIGLSYRERTFDARYRKVAPLVPRHLRLEVRGRIGANGKELTPLSVDDVRAAVRQLWDSGVESIAIGMYNAYANPAHERLAAEVCRSEAPAIPVTCSVDVDARLGEYERLTTATLNASAVPEMRRYTDELRELFPCPTLLMNSAGGVLPVGEAAVRPIQLALSGPAAGVLAALRVAQELGIRDAITLDMGGTSADVSVIEDNEMRERDSFDIAWCVPARIRSVDIRTIGAGGGSIAWRDEGGALRVGPRSAGAFPGPACYGRGGTDATVTDANTVLGILPPGGSLGGSVTLDSELAHAAVARLGSEFGVGELEAARGIYDVVNAQMAQAVRDMTVRHGIDPRRCALIAFGGAGGQHAAGVTAELGIESFVIPDNSSVLSATGLLFADVRLTVAQTLLQPATALAEPATEEVWVTLAEAARSRLEEADVAEFVFERWVGLRYRDQWHELATAVQDPLTVIDRFKAKHEQRFGTRLDEAVEAVDVWITAVGRRSASPAAAPGPNSRPSGVRATTREVAIIGGEVDVVDRASLDSEGIQGPALVAERDTVTFVPARARATLQSQHLVVTVPQ